MSAVCGRAEKRTFVRGRNWAEEGYQAIARALDPVSPSGLLRRFHKPAQWTPDPSVGTRSPVSRLRSRTARSHRLYKSSNVTNATCEILLEASGPPSTILTKCSPRAGSSFSLPSHWERVKINACTGTGLRVPAPTVEIGVYSPSMTAARNGPRLPLFYRDSSPRLAE